MPQRKMIYRKMKRTKKSGEVGVESGELGVKKK
jgi:hypothetical protein